MAHEELPQRVLALLEKHGGWQATLDYIAKLEATLPAAEPADAGRDAVALVGELIRTQNNRLTEQPIFIVQQRHGRGQRWDFVTACFTEQGCKDYIAKDGHNLKEPRIYAAGSYRNEEWRAVRKYLMGLNTQPARSQE